MKTLCASILLATSLMPGTAFADSRTHCQSNETDFFTCTIAGSNKVVSLCGSRDKETKKISWMQYRFGLIGHPEMIYPANKRGSLSKFFGNRVYSREGSYLQYDIWFHVGAYSYSVSASESGDEDNKEFQLYVYYNKKIRTPNGMRMSTQGVLNCAQSSEELMGRIGNLSSALQPEPEIEN